jgi:hypothetical protein
VAEIHEINHAIECIFNAISGVVFNANYGFCVLVILSISPSSGIVLLPRLVKNTVSRNGVNSFKIGRIALWLDGNHYNFIFG